LLRTVCIFRCYYLFAAFALLSSTKISAQAQNTIPDRIRAQINESEVRTLRRNTHPMARIENDAGPAPADLPMERILLLLKRSAQQESALQDLLQKQQTISSPEYHRWLTPEEFGRRFGPSEGDVQTITRWLGAHGFQIARLSRGRTLIEFSGTAGAVADAFHTEIRQYLVKKEKHWANATDPTIPAALAPVVGGIAMLHDFRSRPQLVTPRAGAEFSPQYTSAAQNHGLSPADYAIIYNINPLYSAGINGAGSTIAVVGRTNINVQDVVSFRNVFGLPANAPQVVLNGRDPGNLRGGEEAEALLDTSWAGAVAAQARVKFVVSASTHTTDGVILSEEYIVDNNLADVMTESFGACEDDFTQGQAATVLALAQQAAAQGITYIVSSGDSGAAGCDSPSESWATGPASVNILASTPYTVAVGGTQFIDTAVPYWSGQNGPNDASVASYLPEFAWNESGEGGLWAGGGGQSRMFSKPQWQSGVFGIPATERATCRTFR
jgi:pseudomonalisin